MNYNDRVDGCYRVIYNPMKNGIVGFINKNEAITYITINSLSYIETITFCLENDLGSSVLTTFENVKENTIYYSSIYLSCFPLNKSKITISNNDDIKDAIIQISIGVINV